MRPQGHQEHVLLSGRCAWQTMWAPISIVLLLVAGSRADGQSGIAGPGIQPDNGRGVRTTATNASDGTQFYGLLGPVGQPAVYSSNDAELTLAQLICAAGGLTSDAAPLAHVIRNGRGGLQMYYSPTSSDRLLPGDVVVFDRHDPPFSLPAYRVAGWDKSSPMVRRDASLETIGVAFVGIYELQPIVISLPATMATLPQVIAALHQAPELINRVRVVRTSPSAPHPLPGRPPEFLVDGDVIVFEPATIDRTGLAQADPFPSAVSIDDAIRALSTAVADGLEASHAENANPLIPNTMPLPTLAAAPSMPKSAPAEPSMAEPTGTFEAPSMTALSFPKRQKLASADDALTVMKTGLSEPSEDSAITNAMPASRHSQPQEQMPTATPSAASDFSANSYERLAFASGSTSAKRDGTRAAETPLTAVPLPRDPANAGRRAIGSRATTLGITVLAIALICFAASVLWSRIDDGAGSRSQEAITEAERPVEAGTSQQCRTLERLISNDFPLIEEQTILPERTTYHGAAVGRHRIRIDARHDLTGPHFAAAPNLAPSTDAVTASAATDLDKQHRIDTPTATSPASAETSAPSARGHRHGGLLERVLVAMERERRR